MPWEDLTVLSRSEADKGGKKCLQCANTVESDGLHAVTLGGVFVALSLGIGWKRNRVSNWTVHGAQTLTCF